MKDSFKVKFSTAFLEKVFKRLAKKIHDHHVVHLTIVSFFITYEVKKRYESLATQLVYQFAFPK